MSRILLFICFGILAVLFFTVFDKENDANPMDVIPEKNPTKVSENVANAGNSSDGPVVEAKNLYSTLSGYMEGCLEERGGLIDEKEDKLEKYIASLESSSSAKFQRKFALFAPNVNDQERLKLLLSFNTKYPGDSKVNFEISRICSTDISYEGCNDEVIERCISSDYSNGEIWLNSIAYYAKENNDNKVMDTIAGLKSSNYFGNNYASSVREYVEMGDEKLYDIFNTGLLSAIKFESIKNYGYSSIFLWCRNKMSDPSVSELCYTLGEELKNRSKNLFTQNIGVNLQQMISENSKEIGFLPEYNEYLNRTRKDIYFSNFSVVDEIMLVDRKLFYEWLDDLEYNGEVNAAVNLVRKVEERAKYSACPLPLN